ncbi:MAG: hypothetical protein ACK41T_11750 [Pseudobdellovibrio sp.]
MKVQKFFRKLMMLVLCMGVTACSPFGDQSYVKEIGGIISDIFVPGKTSTNLLASSSGTFTRPDVANPPGMGQQPYSVVHSVGDVYQQQNLRAYGTNQLPSGYKVISSVK